MERNCIVGALILAAGKGVRMRSDRPKAMQRILGEPLLYYGLTSVRSLHAGPSAVVVGHKGSLISDYLGESFPGSEIVWQHEQLGTGHALQIAREWWLSFSHVLVLPGDVPLITPDSLSRLLDHHRAMKAACSFISFSACNPSGYGRVLRSEDGCRIIEEKDATEEQKRVTEVNSGVYVFSVPELNSVINLLTKENAQGEYYLPDVLTLLAKNGHRVEAVRSDSETEFLGVNSSRQLSEAASCKRARIIDEWMDAGVRFQAPETTFVGPRVTLASDVDVSPFVQLYGSSSVGSGSMIGSFSVVRDSVIAEECSILDHVVLESCSISAGAKIGPFAYLRDGARVAKDAYVGKFVEVKKSVIGERSKVPHLSYIGDAEIGEDTNIGAGTITCNYDGIRKNPTKIGNRCFVGSDTMFVAPVTLGDDAFTGAGSVITQDVPEGDLAVARAKQRNIPGWGKKKNPRKNEGGN